MTAICITEEKNRVSMLGESLCINTKNLISERTSNNNPLYIHETHKHIND